MAIDFKTKTGGQSEPTQDINVESPDNTVNISQSRSSEEEKIFDLSIKDKIEVKGVDGGAVNVEKSFNGTTGVTTFEISANNATEQNDGFLRAVGKYQIDHAQLIETEEQSESANDAAISLIRKDSEYFPVDGQMMTWKDSEGTLHLSRYEAQPSQYDFPKKNWIQAVYTNDGYTVVLSKSGNETDPSAGDFLIARSKGNGKWETVNAAGYENWGNLFYFYEDNLIIALSRNSSQEIMLSYDSGGTWTKKTLPSKKYWRNIWKDWDGQYVICNIPTGELSCELVRTTNFTNYVNANSLYPLDDFYIIVTCGFSVPIDFMGSPTGFGIITRDNLTSMEDVWWRQEDGTWKQMGIHLNAPSECFSAQFITVEDGSDGIPVLLLTGGTTKTKYTVAFPTDAKTNGFWKADFREGQTEPNFCIPIFIDGTKMVFAASHVDGIYYYKYERSFYTQHYIEKKFYETTTEAINVCYTNDGIFIFGGVKLNNSGNISDFHNYYLIDYGIKGLVKLPPDNWREIPLINDKEEGIIIAQDGQAKTANLGDFLVTEGIDGGILLKTVHSDRTTEYSNYRMLDEQGNLIWVQVAPASMVDNTTKVFSDEACTIEIGIVTAHSYNPNNPNDVTVMIDGESFVYVFQESKKPQSLATTAALISAIKDTIEETDVSILFDGSNFSFVDISEIENLKSAFLSGNFKLIPCLIMYYGTNMLSICIPINIYVTDDYKFNVVYKSFRTLLTGTFTLSIDILSSNHAINFTPE